MYKINKRYYFINDIEFKTEEAQKLFKNKIHTNRLYRGVRVYDATGKRYCFDLILGDDPLTDLSLPFRYYKKFKHPADPIDIDVDIFPPLSGEITKRGDKLDTDDFLNLESWEKEDDKQILLHILQQELCQKKDIAFQVWDQHKHFITSDEQHSGIDVDTIENMVEEGEYETFSPEELVKDLDTLYSKDVDQFYYITKLIKSIVKS